MNRALPPPYSASFYEADDFAYHIEDIEEHNGHVATAQLVDVGRPAVPTRRRFIPELIETTRSSNRKSQSMTLRTTQESRSDTARDDAQDLDTSSLKDVAGDSSCPKEPVSEPSPPDYETAESMKVMSEHDSQLPPLEDDTGSEYTERDCPTPISDGQPPKYFEIDDDMVDRYDCSKTPPPEGKTPPPEDHTASDFGSENSEVDSDVESEVWDAMYNDRYLEQARMRLGLWMCKMEAVKGAVPAMFDQIIYFLRTLRILWQDSQPDCRHIVLSREMRKLWRAQHLIRCKGLVREGCGIL